MELQEYRDCKVLLVYPVILVTKDLRDAPAPQETTANTARKARRA